MFPDINHRALNGYANLRSAEQYQAPLFPHGPAGVTPGLVDMRVPQSEPMRLHGMDGGPAEFVQTLVALKSLFG